MSYPNYTKKILEIKIIINRVIITPPNYSFI